MSSFADSADSAYRYLYPTQIYEQSNTHDVSIIWAVNLLTALSAIPAIDSTLPQQRNRVVLHIRYYLASFSTGNSHPGLLLVADIFYPFRFVLNNQTFYALTKRQI